MKRVLLYSVISLFLICISTNLKANGVVISNTSLVSQNTTNDTWQVRFNLTWNNSWKDNINSDAVWIFAKYKVGTSAWQHATLNATGIALGTGTPVIVNVSCDQKGAMVARRDFGQGTVTVTGMEIQWNYGLNGVNDTNTVSMNIYGIEMVYIPSGPFAIGDGNGSNSSSTSSFYAVTTHLPYTIDNLMSPNISATGDFVNPSSNPANFIRIDGDGGLDLNLDGVVDSTRFPTGFNAFYMMKYEITQGQYTDFLNALTYAQQTNRVNNSTNTQGQNAYDGQVGASNRYTIIVQTPGTNPSAPRLYSTARPDRGCHMLNTADVWAYLDWVALRPFTELEYEKAGRGPEPPVTSQSMNGTTNVNQLNPTLTGTENGTEVHNSSTQWGAINFNSSVSQGDGGNGPVRVGLLSTASGSRTSAGKSYYGVDNLGDHLYEWMVTVGNVAGRSFIGNHGDGSLHTNGHANEGSWPGSNGNTSNTTVNSMTNTNGCNNTNDAGGRGVKVYSQISSRQSMSDSWGCRTCWNNAHGGRGVRTAFNSEFGFSTASGSYLTINNPVNFEASAFPSTNYAWTFPSGSPGTSTVNPVNATWTTAGTYSVSLQTVAGSCSSTTVVPMQVFTVCVPPSNTSWIQNNTSYRRYSDCGYDPMRTLDGQTDANQSCNISYLDCNGVSTGNPGYLVYDLGSAQTVSKFKLYSTYNGCCCGGGGIGDFVLRTSTSLTGPWTTRLTATGNGADSWQEFNFTGISARYWRIEITSIAPNPNNWTGAFYIQEVAFEGCN